MNHLTDGLSALLDGELSAHDADAAKAHLATCALCTAELAAIDRTRSLVRGLPPVDPPGILRLPEATDDTADAPAHRSPVVAALAGVAAAVALVLLQSVQVDRPVAPEVTRLVSVHATSGINDEPTQLAPAAVPVDFREPEKP